MKYLAFVTHDTKTNSLEATWFELIEENGKVVELRPVRCHTYSAEQKAQFEADCGAGAEKYTAMAGW
jgi:hypothetical protein